MEPINPTTYFPNLPPSKYLPEYSSTHRKQEGKKTPYSRNDQVSWNDAVKQAGLKGPISKTHDDYPRVYSIYRAANGLSPRQDESPSLSLWKKCCEEAGVTMAPKLSEDYEKVKAIFKQRVGELPVLEPRSSPVAANPIHELWNTCSSELGISMAKKGTDEYCKVLELFKQRVNTIKEPEVIQ